jgi:predicted nucleic-acid-binding protein
VDAADTNLLARIILKDDDLQFELARKRIAKVRAKSERLFVPLTVFLELEWVIRSARKPPRADLVEVLRAISQVDDLEFEHPSWISRALDRYETGSADLADYLHLEAARAHGCAVLRTFDGALAKEPDADAV